MENSGRIIGDTKSTIGSGLIKWNLWLVKKCKGELPTNYQCDREAYKVLFVETIIKGICSYVCS